MLSLDMKGQAFTSRGNWNTARKSGSGVNRGKEEWQKRRQEKKRKEREIERDRHRLVFQFHGGHSRSPTLRGPRKNRNALMVFVFKVQCNRYNCCGVGNISAM